MATPQHEFFERLEIADILSRYFRAVDDKRLNLTIVQATFLQDGRVVRPNGSALQGWQEILDGQSKSFARFRATHHVMTDHVIDVHGESAKVQANVTAMHLWGYEHLDPHALESHFVAGGVLSVLAKRTSDGWRFSEMSNRIVWRTGSGFATLLATVPVENRPNTQ